MGNEFKRHKTGRYISLPKGKTRFHMTVVWQTIKKVEVQKYMEIIKCIIGIFLFSVIVSCRQDIKPDEIFKRANDFKLTIHLGDKYTSDSTIIKIVNKNSLKINKLKDWLTNNLHGWESSIVSWATPEISLIGTDFRLLIYKDGAVIGFTDRKGKAKQYTKKVDKSEFNFLIEE